MDQRRIWSKTPLAKDLRQRNVLKSLEGRERERVKAACCLCSLTYCKVLVITKVTYAQRLRNIAPSVPFYSHRFTARYPVSSPRCGCRRGARVPPSHQGVSRRFVAMPEVSLRTAGERKKRPEESANGCDRTARQHQSRRQKRKRQCRLVSAICTVPRQPGGELEGGGA